MTNSDTLPAVRSIALAITLLTLGACADNAVRSRPPLYPVREDIFGPDATPTAVPIDALDTGAFLPAQVVIHPLTRFAENPVGRLRLVCHIELRDRFGHGVKGVGELRVRIEPPAGAGSNAKPKAWHVDLTDPEESAAYFDGLVSDTYQIDLQRLPDWAGRWVAGEHTAPFLRVDAEFRTLDADRRERVLRADHQVHR